MPKKTSKMRGPILEFNGTSLVDDHDGEEGGHSLLSDTRGKERQKEVPQPIRGASEGNTLRADPKGERLAKIHPRRRSPEYREGEHVEDSKCD